MYVTSHYSFLLTRVLTREQRNFYRKRSSPAGRINPLVKEIRYPNILIRVFQPKTVIPNLRQNRKQYCGTFFYSNNYLVELPGIGLYRVAESCGIIIWFMCFVGYGVLLQCLTEDILRIARFDLPHVPCLLSDAPPFFFRWSHKHCIHDPLALSRHAPPLSAVFAL